MNHHRHRFITIALSAVASVLLFSAPTAATRGPAIAAAKRAPRAAGPGDTPAAGAAIAVNPATAAQYAFWRTPSGRIEEAWYTSSWHGPVSRGWRAGSAPAAAVDGAGHQFLAWKGSRGHLMLTSFAHGWSRPQDLTSTQHWGATSSVPALALDPDSNALHLLWRGVDGRIHEAVNTGSWQRPVNLGWRSASAPAAAGAPGHVYAVWRGPGGDVMEASRRAAWSPPRDLTRAYHWGPIGRATSAPAVAINPRSQAQYVFWRGRDGRMREAFSGPGGWRRPVALGWWAASAPSAATSADGHQDVLWVGPKATLYQASYGTSWSGAVGRWRLAVGPGAYAETVETTASLSRRLTPLADVQFSRQRPGRLPVIRINDRARYQRVKGVGAAMTDTSAWLIQNQLPPSTRTALMDDLFTTDGIHLGFTLIPIGGSDFTVGGRPYTYDDLRPGQSDPNLTQFSIAHDQAYILPLLRQMLAMAPGTETFAVPWSPPAWMKANDALDDLGHRGTLLPSAYAPLADYFVKFLEAYAQQGVPIQAIAPENEPRAASAFPAMYFPENVAANWIANYLAPALQAAQLGPRVYGNDTSWQLSNYAMDTAHSAAAGVLAGIAWHCYGGIPTVMTSLHASSPSLDQIVTECAPNLSRFAVPEIVIGAMRSWASEVTLWNLATDPAGGPVEPPNSGCGGCRGVVTIDERTHRVTFGLDYYQLGQIGKFVQSGAWRIGSNSFISYHQGSSGYGASPALDDVALRNPDGSHVLIVYNNANASTRFAVTWQGRVFTYTLPARATVTFRWNP